MKHLALIVIASLAATHFARADFLPAVKQTVTVTITGLSDTYNGLPQPVTITTNPVVPEADIKVTYNRTTVAPADAGTYAVVATVASSTYTGSAKATLVIAKAAATIALANQTLYYGQGVPVSATTNPANLDVTYTYNGRATLPNVLGTFTVVATINNTNYNPASATATLTVTVAPPEVYLGATGAEVSQGVVPGGVATSVYFEYGTTTAYGSVTATQSIGRSDLPVNVFALFPGLLPNTLYHYRLATVTSTGTTFGPDQTFTTPAFDTQLVAASKITPVTVPAATTTFASFGNPGLNSADTVAFNGVLTAATGITTANYTGIWTANTSDQLTLIAQAASPAPGTSATYLTFGVPLLNDNGAIAYGGSLKVAPNQATAKTATGIWSNVAGSLQLIARQGSPAPGTTPGTPIGTFNVFTSLGLYDTGVVLYGTLNGSVSVTKLNATGIWEGSTAANLALKLRLGQIIDSKTITAFDFMQGPPTPVLPYVTGQTRNFNASGDLAAGVTFSDATFGIATVIGGTASVPYITGTSAAGVTGATYATFSNPAINNSDFLAFSGTLTANIGGITTANNGAVWADDSTGTLQLIAQSGTGIAPGTSATFASFSDPVYNNNEAVAFRADLTVASDEATTSNDSGIWCNSGGSLALVAQEGVTQAAGCPAGATFAGFNELGLPDVGGSTNKGGVIFLATLNASTGAGVNTKNNLGIWAVDSTGTMQLIVRTGDTVDVGNGVIKTITGLTFLTPETGQTRNFSQANGDIAYLATFSDRTSAIFNVVF